MASDLAQVGAEPIVVQGALSASEDEARHRDLCALIAARFGEPSAKNYIPPRTRIGRSNMDPRDRVLWEVVAVCCISETMNTSLLTRCQEVAKDPQILSTIRRRMAFNCEPAFSSSSEMATSLSQRARFPQRSRRRHCRRRSPSVFTRG